MKYWQYVYWQRLYLAAYNRKLITEANQIFMLFLHSENLCSIFLYAMLCSNLSNFYKCLLFNRCLLFSHHKKSREERVPGSCSSLRSHESSFLEHLILRLECVTCTLVSHDSCFTSRHCIWVPGSASCVLSFLSQKHSHQFPLVYRWE